MADALGFSSRVRVSELENGRRDVTDQVSKILGYLDRYGPLDAEHTGEHK